MSRGFKILIVLSFAIKLCNKTLQLTLQLTFARTEMLFFFLRLLILFGTEIFIKINQS